MRLAVDEVVSLTIELPARRMTDDHVTRADVAQHRRKHFARVRAFFGFGRTILARDTHVRTFETIGDGFQRRENGRDDNVTMVRIRDQRLYSEGGVNGLANGLVHLPVSGDYGFAHRLLGSDEGRPPKAPTNYLSVNAATPGNSSPARNSRVAPPPVEMCVMRSATPARVTAETESPPPTITVAPRSAASATACATPIVPRSNGGSSNTPIGPFQMIRRASSNAEAKWSTVSTPISMPTSPILVNSIGIVLVTILSPLIGSKLSTT